MSENKAKLIALISAIEEENIIDYLYTFSGLKVYGKAKIPESIEVELWQLWKAHLTKMYGKEETEAEEEEPEPEGITPDEEMAMYLRYEITRAIYDIKSTEILNYINIIVSDIVKEIREGSEK